MPIADCTTPIVAADPSTQTGDTTGQPSNVDSNCQNSGSSEVVYQVTAAQTGILEITLDSATDLGIYVQTDCGDVASEVSCVDDNAGGDQEFLAVPVTQGDVVFVFVDGYAPGEEGTYSLDIKSRAIMCGDGFVEGTEECDPPDGVTCDVDCTFLPEDCGDGVDNDGNGYTDCEDDVCLADPSCPLAATCSAATAATASNPGDTTAGSAYFAASCTGFGASEIIYSYTPASDGVVELTLQAAADLGLYARSACDDPATELACADGFFGGTDEHLTVPAQTGVPITIFVDGYDSTEAGPFTLLAQPLSVDEVEPNDDTVNATPFASPYQAAVTPSLDQDYIEITVPGPSSMLTAQVDDLGNGACLASALDSEVEIYATNGTTSLAFNDDIDDVNGNFCSLTSATGLAAGTYFVRVSASQMYSPFSTFPYRLIVTVQ
jgi:hypothetical protein